MSRYSKSDYINREMAADCIVIECDGVTLEQARQAIKDCPSADVVEVVRCKDCKWWTYEGEGVTGIKYGVCQRGVISPMSDYCSYGERKDDECK